MKKILNIMFMAGVLLMSSCDREFDSEGVAEGVIRFPSVFLNGEQLMTTEVGGEFTDPGATAFLGEDDISSQVVVDGVVDTNTPGVYIVTYTVSTTNELGDQSVVSESRYINVTSEDVSGVDLTGGYRGTGFSANPRTVPVAKLANGWYSITDVLSSGNNIGAFFAHNGGDDIIIPNQTTGFGDVNTTADGAGATLTPAGFTWTVFISCCGNFGPIVFVKQ